MLPTSIHLGQSGLEVAELLVKENHSNWSKVAQHALVLGPSDHVKSDLTVPAQLADPAIQSDPLQESAKSKSTCLAPRESAIKEQGFSEAVVT